MRNWSQISHRVHTESHARESSYRRLATCTWSTDDHIHRLHSCFKSLFTSVFSGIILYIALIIVAVLLIAAQWMIFDPTKPIAGVADQKS